MCTHSRIKDYFSEESCKKYDEESHQLTGEYIVKCQKCKAILERNKGKKKELHNFSDGECRDCGYEVKNCEHEETEKVVSYWYNSVNERGNDTSYVEYDIVCVYCDTKLDTLVHYGPVTAIEASNWCKHNDVEEKVMNMYYEPCTAEKHYKLTNYIVVCLDCGEEFNKYTEEREENHEITDGKCVNCIYETPEEAKKSEIIVGPKPTTSLITKNQSISKKPKDETVKENSVKVADSNKVPFENMYLSNEYTNYSVNDEILQWKSNPTMQNNVLQVPVREFAEIMGWEVTWDEAKKVAYVTDGNVVKTFIPNSDVYMLETSDKRVGLELASESKIIGGTLYTDLEAMLEGTKYSYYRSGATYRVTDRAEVINWVSKDQLSGRNQLETSTKIYEADDYIFALENNRQMYIIEEDGTFYATVIEPMAEQGVYGNYYEGEATVEGVFCRILVGELPFVGTVADIRDLASHGDEEEWTLETTLDLIAVIPIVGMVKYIPELAKAAKNADEVVEGIEIVADLTKNADEVADASKLTGTIIKSDDLVKAADDVIDISKGTEKAVQAAKASIKDVGDLKALSKNKEIFSESAWNHIFYGNRDGGYHYRGLSGEKGKIISILDKPNKYGVYRANVEINGKKIKESTFFPDDWTPKEVVNIIEEAYANTKHKANSIAEYTTNSGMTIKIVFDELCKIKSAFPLY